MEDKSVRYIRNLASRNGEPVGPVTQKNTVASADKSPKPCALCGGTGWKPLRADSEKVTRCDCFMQVRAGRLLERAGIPARYENCEFSDYRTDTNHALAAAKIATEKWANDYPLDKRGLLLIGPRGVGKTHLSIAALKQLMRKGVTCSFCDYRELLKRIQNSYNPSVQATELEVLRPIFESEVVVLDDLGAVKPSEWVWDTVSLVLNTRYNDNLTTIITTNFEDGPARKLSVSGPQAAAREETLGDRIGERMRSRLLEMCRLIKVDGKDFRATFRDPSFR
jgi:DNA replication protein DnaC